MNKSKATFAAVVIAAMTAAITVGLFKLYMPGFYAAAGLLAVYGLLRGAGDFRAWLCPEPPAEDLPISLPNFDGRMAERAKIEAIKREMADAVVEATAPVDVNSIIQEVKEDREA